MLSLKDYLIEAEFSEDDLARIISAFERRMPKLLGSAIYRHGGPGASYKVGSTTVIQYYFDDRAFQIRAKGGHVVGIDVWDKYSIDRGPSYSVNVDDLSASSLLGAMTKLAGVIKNPSVGEVQVKNLNESIQLDEMAKRADAGTFYQMMVDEYGENNVTSVTWDQIKAVADKNDVLIPAYIRDQKIGRGKWDARVGASTGGEEPAKKAKQDPILYIKITAQDPVSKKFITAGDSKQAQDMYSQIQGAISNSKPTEAEVKDPETLYGHLAQLVEMACKGSLRSLLIYGGPGTGKTYTIMKTIQEKGMVKGKDYVKLSGKASPVEIYKTLFMYRDKGLVVFDDLDSMWRNEDATNILKAALDTSPVREISWVSAQTINVSRMSDAQKSELFKKIDKQINGEALEDEAVFDSDESDEDEGDGKKKKKAATSAQTFNPDKLKYPSMFDFTGRVIFISNLKKEEFDTAIMSRSAKINMDMTPQQILIRMRAILPSLGGDDVSLKQKEELLDHLLVMHGRKEITAVTMREFTKGLDIVRSGVPNWKELIQYA